MNSSGRLRTSITGTLSADARKPSRDEQRGWHPCDCLRPPVVSQAPRSESLFETLSHRSPCFPEEYGGCDESYSGSFFEGCRTEQRPSSGAAVIRCTTSGVHDFFGSHSDISSNLPEQDRGDISPLVKRDRGAAAVCVTKLLVRPLLPNLFKAKRNEFRHDFCRPEDREFALGHRSAHLNRLRSDEL